MTQTRLFSNEFPGNWRLVGEMVLPVDPTASSHIYAWLVETLQPLGLNTHLFNKFIAAAQMAAKRAPSGLVKSDPGNVRMLIYTPEESLSGGQSWGYFWVEKKGDPQSADPTNEHIIAFYLYREGI